MSEEVEDKFRRIFKYYKSKLPPPKLDKVIDATKGCNVDPVMTKIHAIPGLVDNDNLIDSSLWKIHLMDNGITIITNPFKPQGISYWTLRCLQDFSQSKNNLKDPKWFECVQDNPSLRSKLRWATLGFHHDWDTKVYDEKEASPFPSDLAKLCQTLLRYVPNLLPENYQSEAAIINYYPMDASLGGHIDHSEPNRTSPLVSVSLGQSAIFLIGGPSKTVEPVPILLQNGDVIIMSQQARQSYHAVPKIIPSSNDSLAEEVNDDFAKNYLQTHRINMNVRQVF